MLLGVPVKQFAKELYEEINEDDIFNGAAALGFYLTLAIFPAMIFVMAVIPFLPIANVDQAIMDLLRQALPSSAAQMFSDVVTQITTEQRGGLLSIGFAGALWATSTGMYAIMQQLNITYDVVEARGFIRARLTAIALSVLFAVLVLGGFSMIVLGGQIQDWLGSQFGFSDALLTFFIVLRWAIIVFGLLMAFALIYYLAPNVKQRFAFITVGSAVGVFLLMLASVGFAWYAQSFGDYDAMYGSIGAVVILMLWLYIAGLAILVGSEINSLIEHHSPQGKEKGEHVEGEKERNPATRQRARNAAPETGGQRGGADGRGPGSAAGVPPQSAIARSAWSHGAASSGSQAPRLLPKLLMAAVSFSALVWASRRSVPR